MAMNALAVRVKQGARTADRSVTVGARNEDQIRRERPNLYKSFLLTRLLVGFVGVLLPTVLVASDLGSDFVQGRALTPRGSLSAYYYHPAPLGDWFVGSLWAIGVGLMVYMSIRKSSRANAVSWTAGSAAIVVALFPTNDDGNPSTWVSTLHFGAAAVVVIGLGLLCWGFAVDDRERTDPNSDAKKRRHTIHSRAAMIIFASVVFVVLNSVFAWFPSHGILVAEVVAVYAFAVSWFVKGWEWFEYNKTHPADEFGAPAPPPRSTEDPGPDQDPTREAGSSEGGPHSSSGMAEVQAGSSTM